MKIACISVADWADATSGMSLEEEGYFWRMVRLMYSNDGVFPSDDKRGAKAMNTTLKTYRRLKGALLAGINGRKPLIRISGDRIVNDRVLKEVNKVADNKYAASERGKTGAETRWRDRTSGQVPMVFPGKVAEKKPKKIAQKKRVTAKNNDLEIASPISNLQSPEESPLPPKGRDDKGRYFSASKKTQEINPYRKRDPMNLNYNRPNAEEVGIGWSEDGNLVAFNGVKTEMLKLSGTEEQLGIDLLVVQASPKVSPGLNPFVLKSKALGVLAEVVSRRRDSDRRYQQAVADKRNGTPAKASVAKLSIDQLPPTQDEAEIARRFDQMLVESAAAQQAIAAVGRDRYFQGFRIGQLKRAGVREDA